MQEKQEPPENPWEIWKQQLRSASTRKKYPYWLSRLLKLMTLTPEKILAQGQDGAIPTWNDAKRASLKLPATGRHIALNALKNFQRFNGIYPPNDRIQKPDRVKGIIDLKWEDAQAIISKAKSPYNLIFELNLHCGWGNQEILKFNTAENWQEAREHYNSKQPPYFRYNFPKRKTNPMPYYSLIPRFMLRKIFASNATLPFQTKKSSCLDMSNYENASTYLEAAFREARGLAKIRKEATVHDLRDAFDTYASIHGIPYEAREFAMGHQLDPRLYDKCWNNEPWMWNELTKILPDDNL